MDDFEIIVTPIYGSVELQQRIIPILNGLAYQGRSIRKDQSGVITEISEWETSGTLIMGE